MKSWGDENKTKYQEPKKEPQKEPKKVINNIATFEEHQTWQRGCYPALKKAWDNYLLADCTQHKHYQNLYNYFTQEGDGYWQYSIPVMKELYLLFLEENHRLCK